MTEQDYIIGGGMTGLAAGIASGLPVLEATESPGGICSSYYVTPGSSEPLPQDASASLRATAYRFEIGGGHWIFGGDPTVLRFVNQLVEVNKYARRSSVYFPEQGTYVDYPLQNHLRQLTPEIAIKALAEMAAPKAPTRTMAAWLEQHFGQTLAELFFNPFNELYTAGLYDRIAPQDAYKSPVDVGHAVRGALEQAPQVGYNTTYLYPKHGLDGLSRAMADRCDMRYGHAVSGIDVQRKELQLSDGRTLPFRRVLSTLPLNAATAMAGVETKAPADPHTSVLVLNIGAVRGARCPEDHWLYIPASKAGFHRVGFYSNVDDSFLPENGDGKSRTSIYVETAYLPENKPSADAIASFSDKVVEELTAWGFIDGAEVVHPTWVDAAYTWSWPASTWRGEALSALEGHGIYQIGRYGRWIFQGIADSIRDGFAAGSSFR